MRYCAVVFMILLSPGISEAQECYRKVLEFSEGICAAFVRMEGRGQKIEADGELSAELSGILKSLTDLGGKFGGKITEDEYSNILREDVPDALKAGQKCRLDVAKSFFDRICPASGSDLRPREPEPGLAQYQVVCGVTPDRARGRTLSYAFNCVRGACQMRVDSSDQSLRDSISFDVRESWEY